MTELEQECIRRISEAKMIPAESIGLDTPLPSIAFDSLDRVSLCFDVEEQYGIEIPESQLHTILTVGDVVRAVERELAKKEGAASVGEGEA